MFNALVMSYSRLPLAMAQDGMLPKFFAQTNKRTGVTVAYPTLRTYVASRRVRLR
jgi:amino acid transporter